MAADVGPGQGQGQGARRQADQHARRIGPFGQHSQQEDAQQQTQKGSRQADDELVDLRLQVEDQHRCQDAAGAEDTAEQTAEPHLELTVGHPVADHGSGQGVDAAVDAAHGSREQPRQQQPQQAHLGDLGQHEVGQDLVLMERGKTCGGCGGSRDFLVVKGVEGGAHQEEDQAYGSRHHPVDDQGALGRARRGHGHVPLHRGQRHRVPGEESEQADGQGGIDIVHARGHVEAKVEHLELAVGLTHLDHSGPASLDPAQRQPQHGQHAASQGDGLEDVGPDHGLEPSQGRVQGGEGADAHQQPGRGGQVVRAQTQHRFDDVADGVEEVSHPGEGVDHEERTADQPDGPVEAQLQVFVGAGHAQAVEKRHEDPADHRHHQERNGNDGEVDVVVAEGRLGGKAHEGVGAEDGGEHGKAHRHPGHFPSPQEKVLVGVLLAGEPQAQGQHRHQVAAK